MEELVRMETGSDMVVELPQRQFSINDSLTMKFLRDLAKKIASAGIASIDGDLVIVWRDDKIAETVVIDTRPRS